MLKALNSMICKKKPTFLHSQTNLATTFLKTPHVKLINGNSVLISI